MQNMSKILYCSCGEKDKKLQGIKEVCVQCGAVWLVDGRSVLYNLLVEFLNKYKVAENKLPTIFGHWKHSQTERIAVTRIFEFLGLQQLHIDRFMRNYAKKMSQMYGVRKI